VDPLPLDNDPEIKALCDRIENAFRKKIGSKSPPSVRQQLDRVKDLKRD